MRSLRQGDIAFVPFPYEEDKTVSRRRPCLVLAVDEAKQRFLGAKITTTELKQRWAFHLNSGTKDTLSGAILRESWINLNRREWFSFADCIQVFARLRPDIMNAVLQRMRLLPSGKC